MIKHVNIKGNNHRDKKGILQQFLNEAQKYKPLTIDEEQKATRDQLIKHNMLFAMSVAFRYDTEGIDIMDLISEGMIGLIKAADSFNPNYNNKFISYALFHIQRYIKEFIDNRKHPVRIPNHIIQIKYAISKHQETDSPTLAAKLNIKEHLIDDAKAIKSFVSLDEKYEDGDNMYQVASDDTADKHISKLEYYELYTDMIKCLTDRELTILELRYFESFPLELTQVGQRLNLSRERVRQIEQQAFNKIRNKYAASGI